MFGYLLACQVLFVLMDGGRDLVPVSYKRTLNWGGGNGCTTSPLLPMWSRASWVKVSLSTSLPSPNNRADESARTSPRQPTTHLHVHRARDDRPTCGNELQRLHGPLHRFCRWLPRRSQCDRCVRILSLSDDGRVYAVQLQRVVWTSLEGFGHHPWSGWFQRASWCRFL